MRRRKFGAKKLLSRTAKWLARRPFLACCIALFIAFAFVGNCSKSAYNSRTSEELAYLKILRKKYGGYGRAVDVRAAESAIAQACAFIAAVEKDTPDWDTPDARDLLLATAVMESGLRARFQDSGGDAIGLFQVEYGTYRDLWRRAIRYKHPELYKAMRRHFGDAENGEIKFEDLQRNDIVGAMFARIKYFESGRKIPPAADVAAQAKLYKEVYNTAAGRGDIETFAKKKQDKLGVPDVSR